MKPGRRWVGVVDEPSARRYSARRWRAPVTHDNVPISCLLIGAARAVGKEAVGKSTYGTSSECEDGARNFSNQQLASEPLNPPAGSSSIDKSSHVRRADARYRTFLRPGPVLTATNNVTSSTCSSAVALAALSTQPMRATKGSHNDDTITIDQSAGPHNYCTNTTSSQLFKNTRPIFAYFADLAPRVVLRD